MGAINVLTIAIIIALVIELMMSFSWIPVFYRFGIRVLSLKGTTVNQDPLKIRLDRVCSADDSVAARMLFRMISNEEIAVRHKVVRNAYTPVIHAIARTRFNATSENTTTIEVVGHLYVWVVVLLIGGGAVFVAYGSWFAVTLGLTLTAAIFARQYSDYKALLRSLLA
jgi:hypothetical protein